MIYLTQVSSRLVATLVLLCLLCTAPRVLADPADLSLKAYDTAKEQIHEYSVQQSEKACRTQTEAYEHFAKPYHIGDHVNVVDRRGRRAEGVYYKMTAGPEPIITIGDFRINLSDLPEADKERFIWGTKPVAEFEAERKKRYNELLRFKEVRYNILYEDEMKARGYTDDFFRNTIALGDRFFRRSDLGQGGGLLVVEQASAEADPYREFYKVSVANPVKYPTLMVMMLGGKAVGASYPIRDDEPTLVGNTSWTTHSFLMKREDLNDPTPEQRVATSLRMMIFMKNVGSWEVRPTIRLRTRPEELAKFRFALDPESTKQGAEEADQRFSSLVTDSREYQASIRTLQRAAQDRLIASRLNPAPADEVPEAAPVNREHAEILDSVFDAFRPRLRSWFTKSNPPPNDVKGYLSMDLILGDVNLPLKIGKEVPSRLSDWVALPEATTRSSDRNERIIAMWYRIVELENADNTFPNYRIQYRVYYSNASQQARNYRPHISARFSRPEAFPEQLWTNELASIDATVDFKINPNWSGNLLFSIPILMEQAAGNIAKVTVDHFPAHDPTIVRPALAPGAPAVPEAGEPEDGAAPAVPVDEAANSKKSVINDLF